MARQRLGVVLLVPQPLATQVDGVRRALGDGALGRIDPHITLVPPVNVADRDLPAAFAVVRAAAAVCSPLALRLGPVDTFAPVNPVAYLRVGGDEDALAALEQLRVGCHAGPLDPFQRPRASSPTSPWPTTCPSAGSNRPRQRCRRSPRMSPSTACTCWPSTPAGCGGPSPTPPWARGRPWWVGAAFRSS